MSGFRRRLVWPFVTTMADELAERCSRLNIVNDENEIVDLGSVNSEQSKAKTSLMLVGKVISERAVNLDAL